ncbi:MAG TPA: hypothetical protein DEB17_09165 [Chlorobaculum sp.]|uniref:Uncharacterized protein n=1 Tax=Chlorobaculum tepidum (strain ATCC 49652 / DSM 12025 / NBRC 103806 / TLS) TaxID=194439 RepID=Q8KB78_CHLTE|nr:hypothetical protein CT1911 [Chlorobaculum tepidum TLS]HBU24136.1 hypothetical protein [Chlorobaculum sp.]
MCLRSNEPPLLPNRCYQQYFYLSMSKYFLVAKPDFGSPVSLSMYEIRRCLCLISITVTCCPSLTRPIIFEFFLSEYLKLTLVLAVLVLLSLFSSDSIFDENSLLIFSISLLVSMITSELLLSVGITKGL